MPPYFWFLANQRTWSRLLIQTHMSNGKQCRSRSAGFYRSQLIRVYTVWKSRVYSGSVEPGLTVICWPLVWAAPRKKPQKQQKKQTLITFRRISLSVCMLGSLASKSICLILWLNFPPGISLMWANRISSRETSRMLFTYAIMTLFPRCDSSLNNGRRRF